jgi:hypothetical protein
MNPRTTATGRAAERRSRAARSRRAPLSAVRRPGLLLGVAVAGAVIGNVLVGPDPAAQAGAVESQSVSVARQLGLTAGSTAGSSPVEVVEDLEPLEELAVSRNDREADQADAKRAQVAANQAELDRREAKAEAKAKAKAEAKAEAEAKAAAQAAEDEAEATAEAAEGADGEAEEADPPSAGTSVTATAQISNSAGGVASRVQAAADVVVSNVPGAAGLTIGGTRPSAADPGGHPSGLALDYMVMSDAALGDAIAQYHIANWDSLGVEYIIWQQRMLSSPGGGWSSMEDRGSTTANHYDHVHVNYR